MNQLILAAIAMGVLGEAVTQFTKRIDKKPFNCGLCMTWWLSIFVSFMAFDLVLDCIAFVGIAVFTRQTLWRLWPTMF